MESKVRARRDGHLVTVILAEPGGQRRADGAGTDEEDGSHGAMIARLIHGQKRRTGVRRFRLTIDQSGCRRYQIQ